MDSERRRLYLLWLSTYQAQQEKEVAEAAAEAAHVAERQEQSRLATQPKRGLALLTRLRKAEALLQEAHTRTLRDAVR